MKRPDSINDLIERYLDEVAPTSDVDRLQERLQESPASADAFVEAVLFDALLQGAYAEKSRVVEEAFSAIAVSGGSEPAEPFPEFVPLSLGDEPFVEPAPGLLGGMRQSTSNFFQLGGMPFAYLTSTVVLVLITLIGSVIHVARHEQYASRRVPHGVGVENDDPSNQLVGRITALADVKWSEDPDYFPPLGYASVSLGRKYALDAGLMEITYDTGAKVILEGPCDYTVDSRAGGYLAVGKLTARVEGRVKSEEGRGLAASAAGANHPASSPLFSVRTPTAVVTDLGTEFGVEVSEEGDTVSHVFRGSVKVQTIGNDKQEVLLRANESAQVSRVRETHQGKTAHELVRFTHPTPTPKFVRSIVQPPRRIDLLDIVAGGYGTSGRRGHGIDPASGRYAATPMEKARDGDGQYWPLNWNRMIDGVFVPNDGKTQIDSAGHAFDGFSGVTGRTYGIIWPRAADADPKMLFDDENPWIYSIANRERFMADGHGLLAMHANAGITFDLQEVRRRHGESSFNRFRAMFGLAGSDEITPMSDGKVDFRVFIDGRMKYERVGLTRHDGAALVDVELGPHDRFLTLAASDGGDGIAADWFVLGDPTLEMTSAEKKKQNQ